MINYKIFKNQERTAEKVLTSIDLGNRRIHLVAPTQSGKTGTIIQLAKLMPNQRFLLTSGMMDNHLYNQNSFIAENAVKNIKAMKIHNLLKEPNPQYIIKKLNIGVIVIDENHYGIGGESRLDKFIHNLSKKAPNVVIIWVGATGYQLVNSKIIDDTIQMNVPTNYFGANDVLKSKNFINSENFQYLNKLTSKERLDKGIDYGVVINDDMQKVVNHFLKFKNGLGIVRVSSIANGEVLEESLRNRYPYFNIFLASSKGDESISETVRNAQIIAEEKRVVLIVIGGLKAGVDLSDTKEIVRFVIETYKTCASVSQGLIGRMCGYHTNKDCMFVADREAVRLQASFENDYRVINDEFLGKLFELKEKRLGTNFKVSNRYNSKRESFYLGNSYKISSPSELKSEWFSHFDCGDEFYERIVNLMNKVSYTTQVKNKAYRIDRNDHVDQDNRINSIQSISFKDRSAFDKYVERIDGRFNFTSIFHRFAEKGNSIIKGVNHKFDNKRYAEAIKVGFLYDNVNDCFYIGVRDNNPTKRELNTKLTNNTIFNN